MAVPDWPTTYGYNLFLYPWQSWLLGPFDLFIEHGHRLLGAVAGMITIGLVISVWLADDRRWMKIMSLITLAAIIGQGVLGGARVIQDEVQLAKLHGCLGPAFLALAVAMAVFTSRLWRHSPGLHTSDQARRLHSLALMTTGLSYLQLVVGAHLRHLPADWAPAAFRVTLFFHLVLAAVLTGLIGMLSVVVWREHRGTPGLTGPAWALAGLILAQVLLGCATWVVNYAWPGPISRHELVAGYTIEADSYLHGLIVSGHVATGSLILVTSLMLALRSLRLVRPTAPLQYGSSISAGVLA